jgi:hypothetical protein
MRIFDKCEAANAKRLPAADIPIKVGEFNIGF